jgi:hypothetical protein
MGKQVKTNARLDPAAFITVVSAMQGEKKILAEGCECYLISTESTPDTKWVAKPRQVDDESRIGEHKQAGHALSRLFQDEWPSVWDSICQNSRDYLPEERDKTWVFASEPHDLSAVVTGLLAAGEGHGPEELLKIYSHARFTLDDGQSLPLSGTSQLMEGMVAVYGEPVSVCCKRADASLFFVQEYAHGDKVLVRKEGALVQTFEDACAGSGVDVTNPVQVAQYLRNHEDQYAGVFDVHTRGRWNLLELPPEELERLRADPAWEQDWVKQKWHLLVTSYDGSPLGAATRSNLHASLSRMPSLDRLTHFVDGVLCKRRSATTEANGLSGGSVKKASSVREGRRQYAQAMCEARAHIESQGNEGAQSGRQEAKGEEEASGADGEAT